MASNKLIKRLEEKKKKESYRDLQEQLIKAECDHKYMKHGQEFSSLKQKDGAAKGVCRCKICGALVDTTILSLDELQEHAKALINAIQCVKGAPNEFGEEGIKNLANIQLAVERIPKIYKANYIDTYDDEEYYNDDDNSNGAFYLNTKGSPFGDFGGKKHKNKNKNKDKDKKHKNHNNNRRGSTIHDFRY